MRIYQSGKNKTTQGGRKKYKSAVNLREKFIQTKAIGQKSQKNKKKKKKQISKKNIKFLEGIGLKVKKN